MTAGDEPTPVKAERRRIARSMSRLASCFLIASRLSNVLRPRASAAPTLAIPFLRVSKAVPG